MSTIISAHFDGQHFVPDEPVVGLAPGDRVEVVPAAAAPSTHAPPEAGKSALRWLAENPIDDDALPADLSYQHDHYLYGTPKKPE
jgi:hypothetical protein